MLLTSPSFSVILFSLREYFSEIYSTRILGFPGGTSGIAPPANTGDAGDGGLIPGWEDPLKKKKNMYLQICV